jgi:hypothetical protein
LDFREEVLKEVLGAVQAQQYNECDRHIIQNQKEKMGIAQ